MDHCSLVSLKLENHCTKVANFSLEIFVRGLNGEKILLEKYKKYRQFTFRYSFYGFLPVKH